MSTDPPSTRGSDTPGLETILLTVGGRDETNIDALLRPIWETAFPEYSTVIITHIFDTSSYKEAVERIANTDYGNITPDELVSQMAVTQEIASRLEENAIDYESRATTGTNGEGIVEIAKNVNADRIIVGGRQRSPTGKAIFGSTAQEVMLNAPCPITFIRNQD